MIYKDADGNDSGSDKESDVIILKGLGQKTAWRFPSDLTRCPIYTCRKEFGFRDSAIDHFKFQHTKNVVYCNVCDKPVKAKSRITFESHFHKLHPDDELPEFLKNPVPVKNQYFSHFLMLKMISFINRLFHATEWSH